MSAHLFHGDSSEAMLRNMSNSPGAVTGYNVYNHLQSRDVADELRVPMCCSKCEDKVCEALIEMSGVDEVQTDQYNQKVTVVGMVEPEDVLKRVKCIKKRTELWTHEYSYSNIWSSCNQALTSPHTSSSIPIYGAPYIKLTFDQISYSQSAYGPSYIETTYDHATTSYNQVYDSY
ncbi:hypothetical protein CY35_01G065100 [Sphagnum magellanicum]|nr:hypothetical protein CY35_01G065100 [Sphagnum magellanicum]